MKEEHQYQPLPVQEPANTDESQATHKAWLTAQYKATPPKRLAARAPDESLEDSVWIDACLCEGFKDSAFYVPVVKRGPGRPRKMPAIAASFAHTS